jgi:hypothetical protein
MVRMAAATISALLLGTLASTLRTKWTRQTPNVKSGWSRALKLPAADADGGWGDAGGQAATCRVAFVGGAVLPAAPKDAVPKGSKPAQGAVMVFAAAAGKVIVGACPRAEPDRVVGPPAVGGAQVVVGGVAEPGSAGPP